MRGYGLRLYDVIHNTKARMVYFVLAQPARRLVIAALVRIQMMAHVFGQRMGDGG